MNYSDDELFDTVTRLIRERCGKSQPITPTTRVIDDLELDSVGLIALVVSVEDHFSIELDGDDNAELPQEVGKLVELLKLRLAAASK